MADSPLPVSLVGLVRTREHCTFAWRRVEGSDLKSVDVADHHCLECLSEARRLGYKLLAPDGTEYPA